MCAAGLPEVLDWRVEFLTTVTPSGKTATGLRVPDEVVEALNSGALRWS